MSKKICQYILMLSTILLVWCKADACKIDTVTTYSYVMHKQIKAVVIQPDKPKGKQLPTIYLLHGYMGNYANWIKDFPVIAEYADRYGLMIVCPDGNRSGWYFDSPIDTSFRYETYITQELIPWVDAHYLTLKTVRGRAIAGMSMGGYGALYIAFKHPELFGAAGSMSGAVDFRPFSNRFDLALRLGGFADFPDRWNERTLINIIPEYQTTAVTMDCGIDDPFLQVNQDLHQKLIEKHFAHDFSIRPGGHNAAYWNTAIQYQLLYFDLFFKDDEYHKN